jgi:hypothetical protein
MLLFIYKNRGHDMGLHKFNPKLSTFSLKLRQNKSKIIKVSTLVLSIIILIIVIIYYAYAKLTTTNKYNVVNATVGTFYNPTINYYVDGTKVDNMPSKTAGCVYGNSSCDKSATLTFDSNNWQIQPNISSTGTTCNVYFLTPVLNNVILAHAGGTTAIAAKGTPTFSTVATTDEGMYAMADDYGTSYYYRGAVTNNNVLFGGYCWKVIRINGNGTTRMIYNGTPKDIVTGSTALTQAEYLNITNDATYPYTYDTGTNQWTSTNKTDGATGTITFQVGTAGDYMFYYTVSSEAGYDKATLYVDDVSKGEFSGSNTSSLLLTGLTTSSVIKVTYTKDSGGASGNDNIIFSLGKNPVVSGKTCANTGAATQIGTSAFNTNYNDNAYVGYMYGTAGSSTYDATHANTNSSTIKTVIDNWYNTNLSSYADKISDTEFCNDRSMASAAATWNANDTALGYGTNITYYGAANRLFTNKLPILTCPNKHDRFTVDDTGAGNGDLTYPVSLITVDEVAVAGGKYGVSNNSYYLYTGSYYWTVSAHNFDGTHARGFYVGSEGLLYINYVSNSGGVRPVINLKTGTLFTSGDGTATNSFVIS